MSAPEFRDGFSVVSIPKEPITFKREDDQWLLG